MKKKLLFGLMSIIFFSLWSCDGGVSKYHLGAQSIGLQPYENIDLTYLNIAKEAIEDYYGYDVKILEPIKLPEMAKKETRTQNKYNADKLLLHLKQRLPDDVTKIVGMIDHDIYTRQEGMKNYAIVGKSKRLSEVSIISTYRVKKYANNTNHFKSRLKKIVLKEIGHTIGLSSCKNKEEAENCLMTNSGGSGKILDKIDYHFCDECAKKLNWNDEIK